MLARTPRSDRTRGLVRGAGLLALLALAACGRGDRVMDPLPDGPQGTVVHGQVRDPDGTRLSGAVITMEHVEQGLSATVRARLAAARPAAALIGRPGIAPESHLRSTVSDHEGRFSFGNVSPGNYLLTGTSRHHLAGVQQIDVRTPPVVSMVETTYVDIALTPTGSFYGSVTLENATNHQSTVVYVQGTSFVAVTHQSGAYVMSGVPVGTWTVRATHATYRDGSTDGTIAAAGDSIPLAAMELLLDSNIRPTATAASPGQAFQEVPAGFAGSGADDDGTIQRYEWDFENDGVFDYSSTTTATTTHAYPTTGTFTAKLRVTDNQGAIGLDAVSVSVLPAVFVSATTGNDGNPGTKAQPVASITQGYAVATSQGIADVLVATGDYSEALSIVAGKNVRGGYHPTTWAALSGTSRVLVGTGSATASSISVTTILTSLTFEASNAPANQNSIALQCLSTTPFLQFSKCTFKAGNGGASTTTGASNPPGASGGPGIPGNPGNCDGPQGSGGSGGTGACPGGQGGSGGAPGPNNGATGFQGACSGGAPGTGGPGGSTGGTGNNGVAGGVGSPDGVNGAPHLNPGVIVSNLWQPSPPGVGLAGGNGRGGGGGGGGGAQDASFPGTDGGGNGGGGGGGGGTGGAPGGGGGGGWASFAVYSHTGSPQFIECTFQTGTGGAGGNGGNGGPGGTGGNGGPGASNCTTEVGRGGNGGNGGRGGHGSGGPGGAGGPSYGVYKGAGLPLITAPTYVIGSGGAGGVGGFGGGGAPGPVGPAGLSGQTN